MIDNEHGGCIDVSKNLTQIKLQAKLPWRVRAREWRRKRKRSEAQAELELLHSQYWDGLLFFGTDLSRDALEGESYSRFPPIQIPSQVGRE